jgi:hypothetical protein
MGWERKLRFFVFGRRSSQGRAESAQSDTITMSTLYTVTKLVESSTRVSSNIERSITKRFTVDRSWAESHGDEY